MRETHLDAEVPAIDIVSQEQIASGLGISSDLEELHQIILGCRADVSMQTKR